ncbi:MAG: DUF2142 domain-containing protein [Eubacterium sp.]|nr:DUF2142 domain-containing protein [Eubacterium sp.]
MRAIQQDDYKNGEKTDMLNETEKKDTDILQEGTENKEAVYVAEETENKDIIRVPDEDVDSDADILPDQAESIDTGILSDQAENSDASVLSGGTENMHASALLHEQEGEYPFFPEDEEDYDWEDRKRRSAFRGKIRSWVADHKLLTGVLLFWFLYMMMYVVIMGGSNRYMTASIDVTAVVCLVITAAVVFFLFAHNVRPEKFFLPVILLTGILFMVIMPLGQSPDEPLHLWQAYHLSNKMLGIELSNDGHLIMEKSDRDVPMLGMPSNAELYEDYWESIAAAGRQADTSLVQSGFRPLQIQDYLYLPQAAGVTVGRLLHLPAFWKFMLGRLFNLLFYALLAFAAMKLMPFGKMAVFMLSLTPISVQQSASLSYDAFVNGLAVLITALAFHLAFIQEPRKKALKIILLWVAALFLVPVKGGAYLPISLLPVIVWLYQKNRNRVLGGTAAAAALACVVLFAVTRVVPLPVFAEEPTVNTASQVIEEVQAGTAQSVPEKAPANTASSAAEKAPADTLKPASEETRANTVPAVSEKTPADIAPYDAEKSEKEASEKELPQELTPKERALQEAAELYGTDLSYTKEKGYSLRFFLHRPLDLFEVIGNTMQVNDGWYLESFLGDNLGWMTIGLSKVILYLFALLLFLASISEQEEEDFHERKGLLAAGGLSVVSIALIFAGMLISWSPISGRMIAGVQGRYFIPVALPLLMCFRLLPVKKGSKMDRYLILAFCMALFFIIRFILLGMNVGPQ